MRRARKWLSHLNIVLGGMFLTFFIIDRFNPAMCFIDNEISKWLLCVFALAALGLSILSLICIRRADKCDADANVNVDMGAYTDIYIKESTDA